MASFKFRVQDWLAARTDLVQFSPSRVIERPPAPIFSTQMPWYLRGFLLLGGTVMIGIALIVIAAIGFMFWAIAAA
jgi:hypothetical protein